MKVSGALKRLIKRLNTPDVVTTPEMYPQNYDLAILKIDTRKEFIAGRPEREAKRNAKRNAVLAASAEKADKCL